MRRLLLLLAVLLASGCGRDRRPDLVLVVVDTLRADALGLYGAPRENAPHLAALASEGVVFEHVVAPSSWTKTSMASIFTGLDPARHGVRRVDDALPAQLPTLPRMLHDAGYATLGVQTNPWLRSRFRFDDGFDQYDFRFFDSADAVNARGLALLDAAGSRKPVFLYLHYMDVHAPYRPSPRWFQEPPLVLPGGASLSDVEFVTADHGEAFGEHGEVYHGRTFYPEVYSVPLLVRAPGRAPAGARVA